MLTGNSNATDSSTNPVKKAEQGFDLDLKAHEHHRSRFRDYFEKGMKNHVFKVQDSCRVKNGRILSFESLKNFPTDSLNIASFIPAAGVATRFTSPIYEYIKGTGKHPHLDYLLSQGTTGLPHNADDLVKLPKALYPCVKEGLSFLQLKLLEQKPLKGLDFTICIIPPDTEALFQRHLSQENFSNSTIELLEQGSQLSTLRFDKNGDTIISEGLPSLAPAGHGSLLKLFPLIKKKHPHIESLFIRNIDNVVGCSAEVIEGSQQFLGAHHFILDQIKNIRRSLANNQISVAEDSALAFSNKIQVNRELSKAEIDFLERKDRSERHLWKVLVSVFQTPLKLCLKSSLKDLYNRPLSLLGQVPNLGKDIGGSPVIVDTEDGETAICVEQSHLSTEDKNKMLDINFATHFNPVFAIVELQDSIDNYKIEENPHWAFVEKQWQGQQTFYHESLLYEMIGNSALTNLIFVELPRFMFNPHKNLEDNCRYPLKKWVPET